MYVIEFNNVITYKAHCLIVSKASNNLTNNSLHKSSFDEEVLGDLEASSVWAASDVLVFAPPAGESNVNAVFPIDVNDDADDEAASLFVDATHELAFTLFPSFSVK